MSDLHYDIKRGKSAKWLHMTYRIPVELAQDLIDDVKRSEKKTGK
jgi:hypothetical protein